MSGPITAGFFLIHGAILLSSHAIREARAMKQELNEVREQLRARESALTQARRAQQDAHAERMTAIRRRSDRQQARLERLRSLAQTFAEPEIASRISSAIPASPTTDDDAEWTQFLAMLDDAVQDMEAVLANASKRLAERQRSPASTVTHVPSIDDVLSAYVRQRERHSGLDPKETERLRTTAARILSRVELPEGAELPAELASLARAIVLAPTIERAEALATELRHAVQRYREDGGGERREAEEAAAIVLEQSLRDLGYEVEDIEATLFVDGGAVHFHRPGWENYFVRLRVDPVERTVNFNVVRARGDEETAERRRLDALAEDRWCAEFPRLMQTLAARGLQLDVTRRLSAGEVPVQVVDAVGLPSAAIDELTAKSRPPPLARPL